MSKSLIIIPTHPPHFHWTTKLLDSASSEENIALGFSNQNDANSFNHSFPYKTLITNIPDNEFIIHKKKLCLLQQVYPDYDYVSIIDTESKFIRPTTPFLEKMWNENCFLANHSTDGSRIMKELITECGYDYNEDLYPWFNCMPIYKSELMPGFFDWLEKKKVMAFDFLLFAVYCRYELNMPWRVLDGHAWHGLVENADYFRVHPKLHNQVYWSAYFAGIEKHENIKMLFHLDRHPIK